MTEPMTKEQLEEIERVWAAATPGPWIYDPYYDQIQKPNPVDKHDRVIQGGYEAGEVYMSEADGTAIAKAPEHVAALLAEVKRLRQRADDEATYALSERAVFTAKIREAAQEERAAVAAWLRTRALPELAADVEREEHLRVRL
jgi:hypothetical protein